MKDKLTDEMRTAEKEEMNAKHAFESLVQDLLDTVDRDNAERARAAKRQHKAAEASADAQGELDATTASRDEDQKYLADTIAGCQQKSRDFESRQELRKDELASMSKALEVLQSDAVSGAAEKHLSLAAGASLGLLRANVLAPQQRRVAVYLASRAGKIHSRMLSLLATRVQADPFEKVRKMIKDMIVRLMEEANEETEHKGWCDAELGANKVARDSKSEDVNQLAAQKDGLSAEIAKLQQKKADLTTAIHELDVAVAKATELRTAESGKNAETLQDAREAQTAVAQALSVLKEFYAQAAAATALVQAPMDDAPTTFDAPYQGKQAESGGVVAMLEVISADFSRLESDTEIAEEAAAREFS